MQRKEKLIMPIPSVNTSVRRIKKADWSGLNLRHIIDTGELSYEKNISTSLAPYLTPSPKPIERIHLYKDTVRPVELFAFSDVLVLVYILDNDLRLDYIVTGASGGTKTVYKGIINRGVDIEEAEVKRCMVQFNVYSSHKSVLDGDFKKMLLLFPDRVSLPYDIKTTSSQPCEETHDKNVMYLFNNRYYIWDGTAFNTTGGEGYFSTNDLNVVVKSYYNDGYKKTTDRVYESGYVMTDDLSDSEKSYFVFVRQGQVRRVKLKMGERVADFYEQSSDGFIKTSDEVYSGDKTYYKFFRSDTYEPYVNIVPESGDKIYYYSDKSKNKTYFERVGHDRPYEYRKKNLSSGQSVSGLYEFTGNFEPEEGEHDVYYQNEYSYVVYLYDRGSGRWLVSNNPHCPPIDYAVVHLSRLFGVGGDRVYVSGYNDYTNWQLDSADSQSSENAWCTTSGANTKAGGAFSGIALYDNHVVCLKRDFMHEVYGTKNPFRLADVAGVGTIDNRSICEVGGKLFFVSEKDVLAYTGGAPRVMSYKLGVSGFESAVAGGDGRCYYLYARADNKPRFFVYDTLVDAWSERVPPGEIISFKKGDSGMYILTNDGAIYLLDTDSYAHEWSFETDICLEGDTDISHIKKVSMLLDIAPDARLRVYALYDNEEFSPDTSAKVFEFSPKRQESKRVPIRVIPRMSAHYAFRLHVEGYGYAMLYNLNIELLGGGDKNVSYH